VTTYLRTIGPAFTAPNADPLILPTLTQKLHVYCTYYTSMSTTATSTITSPTLQLRGESSVQASPATSGFPITTDLKSSPFHDIQTGPSRTVLPTFGSLEEERIYRKEHLALVFRIIHRFKLAEGINGMSLPFDGPDDKDIVVSATPSNRIHSGSIPKGNHSL
jgi:hypothetical protein